MKEQRATGAISLRGFYIRRILRIVPAFAVYLLVVLAWPMARWDFADIATAVTWTMNYNPAPPWLLGHLWSLSVEEQFYLLWPAAVVLLGFKRGRNVALGMFLLAPIVRGVMRVAMPHSALRDLPIFPAVCDAIAIGCMVAISREVLVQNRWWKALTQPAFALPMLALAAGIELLSSRYTVIDVALWPFALLAIAIVVEGSTRWERGIAFHFLNSRPMIGIGLISYSLYLWQQPFLNRHAATFWTSFPLNLAAAVVAAVVSYYAIERPIMALRKNLKSGARPVVEQAAH